MEEVIETTGSANTISKLDLAKGYYQVRVTGTRLYLSVIEARWLIERRKRIMASMVEVLLKCDPQLKG